MDINKLEYVTLNKVVKVHQDFILKDLIPFPKHCLNMLASNGGMGKSFLALRLANQHIFDTGENVACWFTEDEAPFVKGRYDTLKENNMVKDIKDEKLFLITQQPPQLARIEKGIFVANYDALAEIRAFCAINSIKLLILDPLIAFYGGSENDNSQARIFMQPFIEFCKQDDITIILIHHAKKPSKEYSGVRGASAFVDAVRCLYEMNYPVDDDGDNDSNKIEDGFRTLTCKKDNRGVRQILKTLDWEEGFEKTMQVLPRIKSKEPTIVEFR